MADEDGRFAFEGLDPGPYLLVIGRGVEFFYSHPEGIELEEGGERALEIRLPGSSLAGRVVDASSGAPVRATVVLYAADGSWGEDGFVGKVATEADGRYRLPFLTPGRYRLEVYGLAGSYGQETVEGIEVGADEERADLDVRLYPGGPLTVVAVDKEGTPLYGASVVLVNPEDGTVTFSHGPFTGEDGRFRIDGLRPGRWEVRVGKEGYAEGAAECEVLVGVENEVRVVLEPRTPDEADE